MRHYYLHKIIEVVQFFDKTRPAYYRRVKTCTNLNQFRCPTAQGTQFSEELSHSFIFVRRSVRRQL